MTESLKTQAALALDSAVKFFASEVAAVSCLGELGTDARFLVERGDGVITMKIYVKGEGAGFELRETLQRPV